MSLKEQFGKGESKAALTEAQALPGKAKDLTAAATAKKGELTRAWDELSGGLPKMVDAIKSRVDTLSASKKLPATLTKDKFDEAKVK